MLLFLQDEISLTDCDASDSDDSLSEDDAPAGAAGVSSDFGMCQVYEHVCLLF